MAVRYPVCFASDENTQITLLSMTTNAALSHIRALTLPVSRSAASMTATKASTSGST